MKKTVLFAAALAMLVSCKKNETEVKTEDTIIEGMHDTTMVDTDTISAAEQVQEPQSPAEVPTDVPAKPSAAKTEKPAVKLQPTNDAQVEFASFGDKILADKSLSKEQMLAKYKHLKQGDTVNVKFRTVVKDVCKKKGCWMSLQLPGEETTFVRFKDYGFFVPLNSTGQEAVVSGKAFVTETSVAELKHYAKDGGKSEAEIAQITKPKVEYGFLADGVLISK